MLTFFDFLGPVINHLEYWGSKGKASRKRKTKLDPLDQFFLTLIKLQLNLREKDIAFHFGMCLLQLLHHLDLILAQSSC